jgi:hypothetical protein
MPRAWTSRGFFFDRVFLLHKPKPGEEAGLQEARSP